MSKKKSTSKKKTTSKTAKAVKKSTVAKKTTRSTKKTAAPKKAVKTAPRASAAKTTTVSPEMSLTQLVLMYVVFLVVNSVVVLVANTLYPRAVVLGTHLISPLQALLQSMAVFSLVTVAAVPVIESVADQMKMKLGFGHWMLLYLGINAAGLWVTARFAEVLGLGVISWQVVLVLALVLDIVQGAAMKLTQEEA